MNTSLTSPQPVLRRVATLANPQAKRLLALSQHRNWDFLVLGQAPMPTEPVRVGDWQIVPVQQDASQIPARTLERVRAIYETGSRPKGFVLVHEAPMLLSAPTNNQPSRPTQEPSFVSPELKSLLTTVAVGGLAIGVATLVAVSLTALFAVSVAAVALDPILVAVTDDDYWVEIDRWWV